MIYTLQKGSNYRANPKRIEILSGPRRISPIRRSISGRSWCFGSWRKPRAGWPRRRSDMDGRALTPHALAISTGLPRRRRAAFHPRPAPGRGVIHARHAATAGRRSPGRRPNLGSTRQARAACGARAHSRWAAAAAGDLVGHAEEVFRLVLVCVGTAAEKRRQGRSGLGHDRLHVDEEL
jgi:hypothetical protein